MWLFTELKRRNVVRVGIAYLASAWLLVQISETLLPVYELPATLIRPLLIILAIGFPLILILSWVYEITPAGLMLEKDVDRSSSIAHHAGKNLDRAIIVVLAIAIGYFAIDKFLLDPVRDSARDESVAQQTRTDVFLERFGKSSIAVLPFVNMSDDDSNEYFSDGISEDLLNLLARIPRLRVISRSTMFQFKGKDIDIRSLAEQLDVSHVLDGSVRKIGNRVRITAQLIEATTDTHLWSKTYDRDLTDVFKIQDEISAEIVGSLQDELQIERASISTATASSNMEAYEAFLRGRHFMAKRTNQSMILAVEEFERAITLDPNYAVAHAELAIAFRLQINGLYGELTIDESHKRAEPHAELALSLAPNLAEAHGAVGFVRWTQGRLDEARKHFEDAIRLNPSYSNGYVWLSAILGFQGYYAEEFSMLKLNLRTDPLSIIAAVNLIVHLAVRHDFEEARKHLRQLQPLSGPAYINTVAVVEQMELGWAAGLSGFLTSYRTTQRRRFHVRSRIAWLLFVIGLEDEALAFIDPPPIRLLNFAGRHDEAFALTEADAKANGTENEVTEMGWVLASDGNYVDALPWLRQYWRIARGRTQAFHSKEWMQATALIQASLAVGSNNTDIDVILDAMDAEVRRNRSAGIIYGGGGTDAATDLVAALAALQSGDREKGFAYLDTAVDVGEYIPLNFEFLRFIYDDPKFAPILAKQEANQAREREKFLSIVCSDNPYADVWVPMESTCSDYAAANVN